MKSERRYDIDWLRVLAMLAVFWFHCARFFGGGPWHLNNTETSTGATVFIGLLDLWIMPLFFLLSGAGSWYALASKTGWQYLLERVKRLLVPLYTVGLLLLIPPQFYFELYSNAAYRGSFRGIWPRYFAQFFDLGIDSPFGLLPFAFNGHLWFLKWLFLISLFTLPLLNYLKTNSGRSLIETLAGWFGRKGGVFLMVIPLMLILISIRSFFHGRYTWAEFLVYALLFVFGYLLPADKRFTEGLKRYTGIALFPALIATAGEAVLVLGLGYQYPEGEAFSPMFVVFQVIMSFATWSWLVFILGMGMRHLNFNHKALVYANEAVLPFYIFHQTIILMVGWFVIPWHIGILSKYLIIVIVSFTLIMALYELLVKRLTLMRFLFGMRPKAAHKAL